MAIVTPRCFYNGGFLFGSFRYMFYLCILKINKMNREELIEKFHESAKNQFIKEYQKNGTIKPKIILFLMNHEDKPNYIYKRVPKILLDRDPEMKNYIQLKKEMKKMVEGVEEDGFDVLSLLHVEYDDEDGSLYTSLKHGKNLRTCDIYEYKLIKGSTFVLPDGSFEREKPKIELVQMNW